MFLHIGGTKIIPEREIIGIFNIQIRNKDCNNELLQYSPQESVGDDDYASFIVTDSKVYLSPIAPTTLMKRWKFSGF